jgi:ligand-binding sensor domain-containing protein/signal transduction histidine kinase
LRSSSTCRKSRLLARAAGLVGLGLVAFATTLVIAQSAHPTSGGSRFLRTAWDAEQGFPGGEVSGIAQSADGYLWIGTDRGLIRFDGLTFRQIQQASTGYPPITHVLGLTADRDGVLWVRLQGSRILRYHDGVIEDVFAPVVAGEADFTAMTRAVSGDILLAGLRSGLVRQQGSDFTRLAPELAMPRTVVISLAETLPRTIWIGTRDLGLFTLTDGRMSSSLHGLPDPKINTILPIGEREVWVGTDNGIARWDGTTFTTTGLPAALNRLQALTMIRDRDGNVWIGTTTGLLRLDSSGAVSLDDRHAGAIAITTLFEDREGNVWAGSARGIERFRSSAFVTYADSSSSGSHGAIYVDARHRTWFAPPDGGLYWLNGTRGERLGASTIGSDVVYSIDGDARDLWIGRQRGGLTHLRENDGDWEAKTYTQADGLAQNSVYAVRRTPDAIWAGTLSGGVSRFANGRFTTYTTANGLASNTVATIARTADGTMWFGTPNGLTALANGTWQTSGLADGLPSLDVTVLSSDRAGALWIGTASGLAYSSGGRIHRARDVHPSLKEAILGIAEDRADSLWLATSGHILRVPRSVLMADSPVTRDEPIDVREFGAADGLRSLEVIKRDRSMVADARGRIWVSTTRGLSVIDPTRTTSEAAQTIVQILSIAADGTPLNAAEPIRISAERHRVTFGYSGVSLSVPERVRYRYRLDGFDREWSEPTSAREAAYTNLGPATYTFRVIASNSEGGWNSREASLSFRVDPVFWQTWWFRAVAAGVGLLLVLAVYRIRLHQMTRQLSVRFEERLAERTRIAQELHDTLLQGFVSASMQLHVAAEKLPAESPAKAPLHRVQQLMSQVIDEGRNAVRGLRSTSGGGDLADAFSGIQQELAVERAVEYRVIVEGQARPLHAAVRDDVYRIVREAIVNAFRHAEAKAIEVEIEYAPRHVRLLVRDDGKGIEAGIVKSGVDGHWGLSGMRERAERIGGRLKLFSRAGAGTEIELFLPGPIAFRKEKDHG